MEVRNIDMAVLDRSQTLQSRNLISEFQHSKWFEHIILVDNEDQVAQNGKNKKGSACADHKH